MVLLTFYVLVSRRLVELGQKRFKTQQIGVTTIIERVFSEW
jgi:hypothetical protein